ncbi:MAG: dephospho-CoA kinase [Pseudomonadota bacterium]
MTLFFALTGSIGMGKSTTAQMFRNRGIPVHDSDATVHALYSGEACAPIEAAFPGTVENGTVNRQALGRVVLADADAMKTLEAIVHPMVRDKELAFRAAAATSKAQLAILDIPLLFETGGADRVDGIIVVTAPASVQRARVLARPGMDEDKFNAILQKQVPDDQKRARADFIIDTSMGLDHAQKAVDDIIATVQTGDWTRQVRSVNEDGES